ncbi:hypothetical protein CIB84_011577 [Bambusicola thoracicus]|uniref:Uncharacterized protein n=1 Tax=Bambusicola thoracicus TaxID=9083 RepID=A0A2P4SKP5_BAMTH|nr:hypothetical protein CIB84_011577 [Bambusicola thoracicus]
MYCIKEPNCYRCI